MDITVCHDHAYLSRVRLTLLSAHEGDSRSARGSIKHASTPGSPNTGYSSSSSTPQSQDSKDSYASSFAHLLRDRRGDKRLFKRKSRPPQHLQKQLSLPKHQPSPTKSASFYRPKIVEDTAILAKPSPPSPRLAPAPQLNPPNQLSLPPVQARVRKETSSDSLSEPLSPLSVSSSPQASGPAIPSRHLLSPELSPQARLPRKLRIEMPSHSQTSSRASSPYRLLTSPKHQNAYSHAKPSSWAERYVETPPEGEPRTPYERANSHGDHYFRTFGRDTVYEKAPSPSPLLATLEQPKSPQSPQTPASRLTTPHMHSAAAAANRRERKRSSVFSVFHSPRRLDNTREGSSSESASMRSPSPAQATPDVHLSSTETAKSRRRSNVSTDFGGSYFPRTHRHPKSSSEMTPSSANSMLSTNWEDIIAENQPSGHVKEMSTPMSPFSMPQRPVRPTFKRNDPKVDVLETTRELPAESIAPVMPSGAVVALQPTYKSANGKEYYKTSITAPGAPSFLPSEMKRVNTPPLKDTAPANKKTIGFKGLFFDMRSIPLEQQGSGAESPVAAALKRRTPILPKASLQSLLPKLSMPKLKRKASERLQQEPEQPADPLEVTSFHQTPFSQRYGDTRRAKMSQIRSYVDDSLKDDDDDSAMFPFESDVPEHLPNSPLCPLSAKHKSGGKAICPIHRRRRETIASTSSTKTIQKQTKQAPRIVYESKQGDNGNDAATEEDRRRFGEAPSHS